MTIIFVIIWLPETKGTTPEELRENIVRSLSTMLQLSDDSTNDADTSSSVGNPIDVEWRRAMDSLRRQEEEDMKRGLFSKFMMRVFSHEPPFTLLTSNSTSQRLRLSTN
mmetsp:Transcript_29897/g.61578  ORF Transcript_29897/g.61578 Transcript_29897/m.61578 type:complete len:109 (-) Transcript_29897:1287-1613(-)